MCTSTKDINLNAWQSDCGDGRFLSQTTRKIRHDKSLRDYAPVGATPALINTKISDGGADRVYVFKSSRRTVASNQQPLRSFWQHHRFFSGDQPRAQFQKPALQSYWAVIAHPLPWARQQYAFLGSDHPMTQLAAPAAQS